MDIKPHKIIRPFQLLAFWILGMVLILWEFIYASLISIFLWQRIIYTICAILFGIIFIRVIFLLQTKYRADITNIDNI